MTKTHLNFWNSWKFSISNPHKYLDNEYVTSNLQKKKKKNSDVVHNKQFDKDILKQFWNYSEMELFLPETSGNIFEMNVHFFALKVF